MKDRKYPIPTWVWELRSRTLSFLKKRHDLIESHNEYMSLRLQPRFTNSEVSRIVNLGGNKNVYFNK